MMCIGLIVKQDSYVKCIFWKNWTEETH